MDYIVSAEDTPYYHWQLELLIESFKRHGLQEQLLIVLASRDVPHTPDFTRNLSQHKRVITQENKGRQYGYPYLNRPYAVQMALAQGELRQPFTLIAPDMLLFKPPRLKNKCLAFHINDGFTLDVAAANLPSIKTHVAEATGGHSDCLWVPLGSVCSFHDVPEELFNRAVAWAEILTAESKQPFWKYTERAGWVLAFLNFYGYLPYKGSFNYEMTLLDNGQSHFIHYTHGIPPVFSKYMFRYEPPHYIVAAKTPFDLLMQETPTHASLYMQQIVKSYLGN